VPPLLNPPLQQKALDGRGRTAADFAKLSCILLLTWTAEVGHFLNSTLIFLLKLVPFMPDPFILSRKFLIESIILFAQSNIVTFFGEEKIKILALLDQSNGTNCRIAA